MWQHNFTIATVVKMLTKGLCPESGLHSLPSRTSRYPRFTAWPKIQSQSQIFRHSQRIFCLPHRTKFSDIFGLCLYCVSIVRGACDYLQLIYSKFVALTQLLVPQVVLVLSRLLFFPSHWLTKMDVIIFQGYIQ